MKTSIKSTMQKLNTISEIFEKSVEREPLDIALESSNESITYEELNEKANQIAHTIIEQEKSMVEAGVVGIFMDKSIDAVVAMLGIMKAGLAYVPIDVTYPKERIDYIIENSQIDLLISSDAHKIHPSLEKIQVIDYYGKLSNETENVQQTAGQESLAYIIYTSGTTGNPKGVMVTQGNVIGLMKSTADLFSFNKKDKWSLFHSFCFDFSVWEIYGALLYGACGVIVETNDVRDPLKTVELLKKHEITVFNQVPSSFYTVDEALNVLEGKLTNLRYVIFGGEGLKPKKLASFHEKHPNVKLINMYGITEITVHGTYKEITGCEISTNDSNIGKPLPGLEFDLIDSETSRTVPNGEIGEIIVSGYGVAQGYMNNPEMSREKFIIDPVTGDRRYCSGDLGRKNSAGEIIYSGRKDSQVQLKGFRVELSEVEAALMKLEGILDAVVLVEEDQEGNDELLAFFVSENHVDFTVRGFRKALQEVIPVYMLPYHFIPINTIPLTLNGKYDRKKLLERKQNTLKNDSEEIKLPETLLQKKVLRELSKILHIHVTNLMDNFFELGGDSLKAAKLINCLKQNDYKATIEDLFQSENLDVFISTIDQGTDRVVGAPSKDQLETLSVSNAEKRIFSASMGSPEGLYNITTTIQFKGRLNVYRLEQAINQVLSKYEIFSIKYEMTDQGLKKKPVTFKPIALIEKIKTKKELIQTFELQCPKFKPDQYPLHDFKLFRHEDDQATLLLNVHHIIFDGISQQIFLKEVLKQYDQGTTKEKVVASYQEFIDAETAADYKEMKEYWKEKTSLIEVREEITKDHPRPQKRKYLGKTIYQLMDKNTAEKIKNSCKELKITASMYTQGVFHLLLSRLTGTEKIITGTIASGRTEPEFEESIGMFVNTLPFLSNTDRNKEIATYFSEIKTSTLELLKNQNYPLDKLITDLELPHSNDRNPLFDYMFIYQSFKEDNTTVLQDGTQVLFDSIQKELEFAKFDLTMEVLESGEDVYLKLNYDKALFEESKMTAFIELYKNTLVSVNEQLGKRIQDIAILSTAEIKQIKENFNNTYKNTLEDQRELGTYIADKLKKYPKKKAVVCAGESLSFEQVDGISNYYAKEITKKGIGNNDIVGILLPRSSVLYTAMLAVVKSGAGLLLIDPSLPENRKKYIINDSQCSLIITESETEIVETDVLTLCLPSNLDKLKSTDESYLVSRTSEDLSYVIYTSGTTGNPKGVKLKSNSAVNMSDFLMKQFDLSNSVYLTVAAVTFDMFVLDFFVSLAMEATFVLPTEEERINNYSIATLISRENVEATIITPTRLDSLIDDYPEYMEQLKVILCGGENLQFSTSKKVLTRTNARLFNFYGPSETSVYCSGKEIVDERDITIGVPAAFSKVYVVDTHNNLLPIGYEGELCIGGHSVGKGYIGKEELTAEKFIKNPFHEGMMYRTGDHAVYRADGELIYKGRKDHQIKLNGFRIELQEIENVLLSVEQVEAAHVHLGKQLNGVGELRGFVIGAADLKEIEKELKNHLPYYMMPKLINVPDFPMTRNGKIDVAALDNIFEQGYVMDSKSEEAETVMEELLLSAYRKILSKPDFGVTDNFFYNGGDSIKAIQLVSILRKAKIEVSVTQIMDHTDVRSLAPNAKQIKKEFIKKYYDETKAFPLTPIQKFYFSKNDLNDENFHQSMIIESAVALNKQLVEECFAEIIAHHQELRTKFRKTEQGIVAEYLPKNENNFVIEEHSVKANLLETKLKYVDYQNQQKISLKENKLLAVSLLKASANDYLIVAVHHLIADGLSLRILLRDFTELYSAKLNGSVYELMNSDSMLNWSNHWTDIDHKTVLKEDISHWTFVEEKVKSMQSKLALAKSFSTAERSEIFSSEITQKLLSDIHTKYNTKVQDILLAAFVMTFKKKNIEDLIVMMEGHGRETDKTELIVANTIGWFTTLFPVVFSVKDTKDVHLMLREVKDTLLKVPNNGFSYGILKYLSSAEIKEEIRFTYDEKPSLAFNYMGEMKVESDGLFKIKRKNETYDISDQVDLNIGLTFNLTIIEGKLTVSAIYNKALYEQDEVSDSVKEYGENLETILTFLEQASVDEVRSAGEFEESGLSNQELDELLAYLSA